MALPLPRLVRNLPSSAEHFHRSPVCEDRPGAGASVELLVAFKLDPTKRPLFETEFPSLGSETTFQEVERIVGEEKGEESEVTTL